MSGKIIWIMIVAFLLSLIGAMAVECGSVPSEDCTVSNSLTLSYNDYELKDLTQDGAIKINGSNLYFDCNNSIIHGNHTFNSIGIMITGTNVTIIDCNVYGYRFGLFPFC